MNDSIGLYLNDIGKVSLLNAEEERELSRVIEAGREAAERLANGEKRRRAEGCRWPSRRRCQGPLHPRQPATGGLHRPPLPPAPGHGPARPHPGGQPGPRARRRQVRLAPWLQVLHLCHLLDPSGHRSCPRPEGQPHPHPRRSFGQPSRCAAPGQRATAKPSMSAMPNCIASPPRCRSTRPSATMAMQPSAT